MCNFIMTERVTMISRNEILQFDLIKFKGKITYLHIYSIMVYDI